MTVWREVELGDICEFKYGKSLAAKERDGGAYPVYGSNGIVGSHSVSLTNGATVVIGRKGSFGEVAYSRSTCWPIDTTYYVDSSSTDADLRWLSYRLRGLGLTELNRSAAVPGLRREDAYQRRLLLPPYDEQRRIAAILDHADALRAKRRQVLALLDALTQSIFYDMFGDDSDAKERTLADLADVTSGITKGRKTPDPTVPTSYLAVANVQASHLKLDVVKTIEATEAERRRYALADGDLVVTEGGDPDKLGRGTVWRCELPLCLHQNHMFRIRIRDTTQVLPDYLAAYMADAQARAYFVRAAKQTTGIASINMTQLRGLPVAVPPLAMQKEYVARAQAVAAQHQDVKRLATADDELFASLQSRAFRGEL